MGSLAKTLSIGEDEEEQVCIILNHFRDRGHLDEVIEHVMQDEHIGLRVNESDGLILREKSMITDGLSSLRVQQRHR